VRRSDYKAIDIREVPNGTNRSIASTMHNN